MGTVLVTGALGLVGTQTVRRLSELGRAVVATDLATAANRKAARRLPAGVELVWADLTSPSEVRRLIGTIQPAVIIHLAAIIPIECYRAAGLARRVNVDATRLLVEAALSMAAAPRFVLASSVAVHGSRNPRRDEPLTPAAPLRPADSYGALKLEAEEIVRGSDLEWLVLKLGAVVSTNLRDLPVSADLLFMEWSSPIDGRINTVDVRDVATAFANATSTNATHEVFMIGGDQSHRHLQGELGPAIVAQLGLADCYPTGRPGDPADDEAWFVCDWMDTGRAQGVLAFQNHSWPAVLAEIRGRVGPLRYVLMAVAPLVRRALQRRMPYRGMPGEYADPWGMLRRRWPGAAVTPTA